MISIVESAFTAAREKLNDLQPNDILKLVGLRVLRSSGSIVSRLPVIAAFGGGLALGAGAAFLFSPTRGPDNRRALVDWAKNVLARVGNGATKAIEAAEDAVNTASDAVEDAAETIKKKAHRAKAHAQA